MLKIRSLLSLVCLLIALMSEANTHLSNDPVTYPASNLKADTYTPGEQWKLVWSDEFDGDTLNRENWNFQVLEAGRFNGELQEYTDSEQNAYVEDNCLVIKAIHKSDVHGPNQYSSARLNTAQKQTWKYGRIAARIQLPYGEGVFPAFWMLGANCNENGGDTPWPLCGEIDVVELFGNKSDAVVEANIHFADEEDAHDQMGSVSVDLDEGIFADQFHVFEIEWDENRVVWFVDGQEYASRDITTEVMSEFHQEFFILLNFAIGGNTAGCPDETTQFPQHMYVDWVRVYQK